MSDWRAIRNDQDLRLAQQLLEKQGEINRLTAKNEALRTELSNTRQQLIKANEVVEAARRIKADEDYLLHESTDADVHYDRRYADELGALIAAVDALPAPEGGGT